MAPVEPSPLASQPAKKSPLEPSPQEKEVWSWVEWYHEKYGKIPDWLLARLPDFEKWEADFLSRHGSYYREVTRSSQPSQPMKPNNQTSVYEDMRQTQINALREAEKAKFNSQLDKQIEHVKSNPPPPKDLKIRKPMPIMKDL